MQRLDVPVAGGTLAVFRIGSGPEDAVAVHGITGNSQSWLAVARALEGRAGLLACDLRGRGASSVLPSPYGMEAYADDILAVLDHCRIERAVLVGHSLGAYAVARFAADHPGRVRAAVLVDGGLTLPGIEGADPQVVMNAVLGPALARLEMTFPTRSAYHDWWRAHPAMSDADVVDADLVAYANHDLGGDPPELHSVVAKDAVRTDAGELFEIGKPAHRLTVPVEMLRAPRGLQNQPEPMIPAALADEWASADSGRRSVTEVPDVNHYTIVMGASGAGAVAQSIVRALQRPVGEPGLRSAG
jgi:pimeloyl-ACP methyl ester carboxylesterase